MEDSTDIKLILLGNGAVGKTSIISYLTGKDFSERYLPTIGHNVVRKEYNLSKTKIRLSIWDLGGQKSFNVINPILYQNIDIAYLIFDLSKLEDTIKNLKKDHIRYLEQNLDEDESLNFFIVGNKLDLINENVDIHNLENYIDIEDRLIFFSAKTGLNLNDCIELSIYDFLEKNGKIELANEFISFLGKNLDQLESQLIQIDKIDNLIKAETQIIEKQKKIETQIKTENKILNYEAIHKELKDIDSLKKGIFTNFENQLFEINKFIYNIKKSFSKSINDSIENFKIYLLTAKKKIYSEINSINKIDLKEITILEKYFNLPQKVIKEKLIKKLPKELASRDESLNLIQNVEILNLKPSKEFSNEELFELYEKENPGKKAMWRGKLTNAFHEWKKKMLEKNIIT